MKDKLITKVETLLHNMEEDPAAFWEDEAHEAYDEMLNECCVCECCGRGGSSLKEEDPVAYRCGFADYMSGETAEDFAKNQGEYGELEDLLETYNDARNALIEALKEYE